MQRKTREKHFLNVMSKIECLGGPRRGTGLQRSILKTGEQLGELSRAFLAVTGSRNYKKLTHAALREHAADVFTCAADMLLYRAVRETDSGTLRWAVETLVDASDYAGPACVLEYRLSTLYSYLGRLMERVLVEEQPTSSNYFGAELGKFFKLSCGLMFLRSPEEDSLEADALRDHVVKEIDRKLAKWERSAEGQPLVAAQTPELI